LLIEGLAVACEVSMTDLHQTRAPNSSSGIDAAGWLFSAFVAAIIAIAAVIAYGASDTRLANAPVSQIVAR
jgi:predicted Co/Zn/Cd cation transporter (cation efflux family)